GGGGRGGAGPGGGGRGGGHGRSGHRAPAPGARPPASGGRRRRSRAPTTPPPSATPPWPTALADRASRRMAASRRSPPWRDRRPRHGRAAPRTEHIARPRPAPAAAPAARRREPQAPPLA